MQRHTSTIVCILVILFCAKTQSQNIPSSNLPDTARANAYFCRAEQLSDIAQFDSVDYYLESARSIYKIAATKTNDRKLWGNYVFCCNRMIKHFGGTLLQMDKAQQCLDEALTIGIAKLGEAHPAVAYSIFLSALAYGYKGDGDNALLYYQRAAALWEKAYHELHPHISKCYHNMGWIYVERGDIENAVINFEKALKIGHQHFTTVDSLSYLGGIYELRGNLDKALEYYEKAVALQQHQPYFSNRPDVRRVLTSGMGKTEGIEYLYYEYEDWLKRKRATPRSKTSAHEEIANLYDKKGEFALSRRYYQEALKIQIKFYGRKMPAVAATYEKLGLLYYKQNEFKAALENFQKAIVALAGTFEDTSIYANPALRNLVSEPDLFSVLFMKAVILEKFYARKTRQSRDLEACFATFQLAADLIDLMRRGYKAERSKIFLSEKAAQIYDNGIRIALRLYAMTGRQLYKEAAFRFAEKNKARILLESLLESQAQQFAGIPASLREQERALKNELAQYEMLIQQEKLKDGGRDSLKMVGLESRYFVLKRKHESVIKKLENAYPKYFGLKYKAATAAVAELQKSLDAQTALLEYFLGDSAISIFAITKEAFEVVAVPRDSSCNAIVASLANSFKNVTSKTIYLQSAASLCRMLVQPLAAHIGDKPRWIIIPDGELHQIPFEALLNAKGSPSANADYRTLPYLIKQHEISYHYSATLFLKSRQERQNGNHDNLFAGFAPVFDATAKNGAIFRGDPEDSLLGALTAKENQTFLITRDGKTLEALPHSAHEVQVILAAFAGCGQAFLKQEATEENFKQKIKGHKFLHVATHGFIHSGNPQLSNLAFSQPQDRNAKEDGILYSVETYNLDLNADLLVLSACQTGAGQIVKGEGLMGLTRGFLYSGARNIVASLWKVYDQHTSLLMVEMYRQIAAGKSYSTALREAKLKMIANAETAAPQSWAGFVLIGR